MIYNIYYFLSQLKEGRKLMIINGIGMENHPWFDKKYEKKIYQSIKIGTNCFYWLYTLMSKSLFLLEILLQKSYFLLDVV